MKRRAYSGAGQARLRGDGSILTVESFHAWGVAKFRVRYPEKLPDRLFVMLFGKWSAYPRTVSLCQGANVGANVAGHEIQRKWYTLKR